MVFSDYLEHNSSLPLNQVVDQLLVNERIARERVFAFLTASKIPYVDTLPALKKSVEDKIYARLATDMHPSRNGYRVIGQAVSEMLKQYERE